MFSKSYISFCCGLLLSIIHFCPLQKREKFAHQGFKDLVSSILIFFLGLLESLQVNPSLHRRSKLKTNVTRSIRFLVFIGSIFMWFQRIFWVHGAISNQRWHMTQFIWSHSFILRSLQSNPSQFLVSNVHYHNNMKDDHDDELSQWINRHNVQIMIMKMLYSSNDCVDK